MAEFWNPTRLVRSLVLVSAYAGWRGSLPPEEVAARLTRAHRELDLPPATWIDSYLPEFSPDRCRRKPSTWSAR